MIKPTPPLTVFFPLRVLTWICKHWAFLLLLVLMSLAWKVNSSLNATEWGFPQTYAVCFDPLVYFSSVKKCLTSNPQGLFYVFYYIFTPNPCFWGNPCPLEQSCLKQWLESPPMKWNNPSRSSYIISWRWLWLCKQLWPDISNMTSSAGISLRNCGNPSMITITLMEKEKHGSLQFVHNLVLGMRSSHKKNMLSVLYRLHTSHRFSHLQHMLLP